MDYVDFSRHVLADSLLGAGPDAPTLCGDWRTRHLAAHLVLRESSLATLGNVFSPLNSWTERKTQQLAAEAVTASDYAALVQRFVQGPRLSLLRTKPVDQAANLLEYFVHTEDVRRAVDRYDRFAPRNLSARYSQLLWEQLKQRARILFRHSPVGVILIRGNGQRTVAKKGEESVAIRGSVGELVLFAHGRTDHALVTFEGTDEAITALKNSNLAV
ncbi:TIGR03085 family metal-binding protein [Micrococcoides hystricis]|uniref:TIGR03085 family metal-binding protein n=1 Tax=Micrococcoides hystricis TaxID=1572761 RepID=A0ABV6P6Z8_9MICC